MTPRRPTRGPFTTGYIGDMDWAREFNGKGYSFTVHEPGEKGLVVALVDSQDRAELYSLAPELLEALKEALPAVGDEWGDPDFAFSQWSSVEAEAWMKKAKALIARAEGEG